MQALLRLRRTQLHCAATMLQAPLQLTCPTCRESTFTGSHLDDVSTCPATFCAPPNQHEHDHTKLLRTQEPASLQRPGLQPGLAGSTSKPNHWAESNRSSLLHDGVGIAAPSILAQSTMFCQHRVLHLAPPFLVEDYVPVAQTTYRLGRMPGKAGHCRCMYVTC